LLREGESIGVIMLRRKEVHPFSDKQIALLQTFADQAVIAIENARLFNETKEALERQTATADVLKVIASSPSNLQPVFDAIAERSKELIGGHSTTVIRYVGDMIQLGSFTPTNPEADAVLRALFPRPIADDAQTQGVGLGEIAQIVDTESESIHPEIRILARARGWRSRLFVPLKDDNDVIGLISVTRMEPGSFADKDVELLRTFADQAVIAIQNVELFEEVKAKTRDLEESLQQQTATADVLKVISRSAFDLQAVLDTLVDSAGKLCNATMTNIWLRDGDVLRAQAQIGMSETFSEFLRTHPIARDRGKFVGRAFLTGELVHLPDVLADPECTFVEAPTIGQFRSALGVPLIKQGQVVGVFALARPEPGGFTDREIELVRTFADQALIAIENVRLFDEVQAKTRDLTESLQQQTATSEVLQVISASTGELEPVFKSMLDNATRICGANFGTMSLYENGAFRPVAFYNVPQAYAEKYVDTLIRPHPQGPLGTVARTHEVVHVEDTKSLPVYIEGNPAVVAISDLAGARTIAIVPMLRENELIGTIAIYRQEVRPFSEKQISLLTNLAKQAVIAIENARLLKELRQRTGDLSQSLDDLRSAQDRLIQTEKLASLGQLTAGIAHEIKNPLNFVNNFSALSAELTDELNDTLKPVAMDGKVREEVDELTGMLKDNLEKVVQHGKRADSIVKNMLLHSR
jgi:GAF domain-containing protein